jgi:DNA-directed RNA polymerase subunit beta
LGFGVWGYVRIDRRRKLPVTVLIRALGAVPDTARKNPIEFKGTTEEILNYFYATETLFIHSDTEFEKSVDFELLYNQRATRDVKSKSGEIIVKKNRKFTRASPQEARAVEADAPDHRRRRALHEGLGVRRDRREHR